MILWDFYEAAFNVPRRRLRRLLKAASSANEAAFFFWGEFLFLFGETITIAATTSSRVIAAICIRGILIPVLYRMLTNSVSKGWYYGLLLYCGGKIKNGPPKWKVRFIFVKKGSCFLFFSFFEGGKDLLFQFFSQFRIVLNQLFACIASLCQFAVVIAEP